MLIWNIGNDIEISRKGLQVSLFIRLLTSVMYSVRNEINPRFVSWYWLHFTRYLNKFNLNWVELQFGV